MNTYSVFGGVLHSELEFPELDTVASEHPDWTFRVSSDAPPKSDLAQCLGEDRVDQGVMVRSYRVPSGFRLEYDDTGTFDINADGSEICWHRSSSADVEAVRLDVLGRVLALALHGAGWLSLHGSGVALDAGAIAFLAPKGNGKSTLAFALMRGGAALMTDDTVVIGAGRPAVVRPGVQSVRLFRDSADWLAAPAPIPGSSDLKATFGQLASGDRRVTRAPLAALYLLESVDAATMDVPVERHRIAGPEAVFALLAQTKIGTLLGGSEAAPVFSAVVALAESTEVYRLRVTRDYDQLRAVVQQIMTWHAASSARAPEFERTST